MNLFITRFFAIFTNLRPEKHKLISQFFRYFHECEKKELIAGFLAIFSNLRPEKKRTYFSTFGYFHEFVT